MGIAQKLAKAMSEIGAMNKQGVNQHFNYRFVESDKVLADVRQALINNGIVFQAEMTGHEHRTHETIDKNGVIKSIVYKTNFFRFTFIDAETGETLSSQWEAEAQASDDKAPNKNATAAVKYFLLKTFLIPTDGEPDSDAEGEPRGRTVAVTRPASEAVSKPATVTALPPRSAPGIRHADNKSPWKSAADAKRWLANMAQDYAYSADDCLKALGVTRLSDFVGTEEEATARVLEWGQAQLTVDINTTPEIPI